MFMIFFFLFYIFLIFFFFFFFFQAEDGIRDWSVTGVQTCALPISQVAVEFTGGQTDSKKNKRFMLRGSAFFELKEGKISRVRVYTPKDEMLEITGPRTASM